MNFDLVQGRNIVCDGVQEEPKFLYSCDKGSATSIKPTEFKRLDETADLWSERFVSSA